MNNKQNYNLDFLKLIACVAVIGLHTVHLHIDYLYYLCGFAVPMFLMCGGYILLNRTKVCDKGYCKRKIYNILRLIIVWNVLRWLVSILGIFVGKDISDYTLVYLVKQIIGSLIQKGKMWQFWYLRALIIIYMLLPVLYNINKKKVVIRNHKVSLLEIVWCILMVGAIVIQFLSMIYGRPLQEKVIQTFRLWSWLQYFILGGMLFHYNSLIYNKISKRMHLFLLCISSVWIVFYQDIIGKNIIKTTYAEYFYDSVFVIIWIMLLFTWFMRIKFLPKQEKCISKLCALTLGVYSIHPIIISIVRKAISPNSFVTTMAVFLLVTIISFICVYVMSKIRIINKYMLKM